MLDTNDCFILDLGQTGVFAWVGKNCSEEEKKKVWTQALEFLNQRNYPKWTPVTRVHEGHETAIFKQAFQWPLEVSKISVENSKIAKIDPNEHQVDPTALHKRAPKVKESMPDQGNGEIQVWRIQQFFLTPVDKLDYGTFYAGDSYVILYKYKEGGAEKSIVYFWQGNKSSKDEKAASALFAAQIDEKETNGQAVQIRVVQGKEPPHFSKIFGDRVVILMGGHASGFKNVNDSDNYDTDGTRLFQVRDNKVIQVPERAASLNSNDVFVLETPHKTFMWLGKGASDEEKGLSKEFAKRVVPLKSPVTVQEGNEPEDFWHALGGKGNYASGENLHQPEAEYPARLFHCTNSVGYFHVEEIVNFNQEDLFEDDAMLLDTFDEIFVWIGKGANEIERKEAMKTAMEYIKTDPVGRTLENTVIVTVKHGFEPPAFTGHFGAWDPEKWSNGKSFDDLKREFGEENTRVQDVLEALKELNKTYPIEVLKGEILPPGVDKTKKEHYLSDEDFAEVFGVARNEYLAMPQWKRTDLKKKVGLF